MDLLDILSQAPVTQMEDLDSPESIDGSSEQTNIVEA